MSVFATIGGLDVIDFRLTMPRYGVWACEAALDSSTLPSGQVDIVIGENQQNTFKGSVELAATYFDTTMVRVRAGAGGMGKAAKPKHYRNVSLRTVLNDLLATSGEKLSSTADTAFLGASLSQWTVIAGPVGRAVKELIAAAGDDVAWRFLADGTFWLGRETWPVVTPTHELLQNDPLSNNVLVSITDDVLVLPGQNFEDFNVDYVEHSLLEGRIRSNLMTE